QALLGGLLLIRSRHWLATHPDRFRGPRMQPLAAFIISSATAADAEQARSQRLRVVAALLPILILGIIAGIAWSNRSYIKARTVMLAEAVISPALNAGEERQAATGYHFRECADCPTMVVVPQGQFIMGSPAEESLFTNERPQHLVRISRFAVSQNEITFDEWDACFLLGGCAFRPWDELWGRGTRP